MGGLFTDVLSLLMLFESMSFPPNRSLNHLFGEKMENQYIKFTYDTNKDHLNNFERWYCNENHNRGVSGELILNYKTAKASFEEVYGKLIIKNNEV